MKNRNSEIEELLHNQTIDNNYLISEVLKNNKNGIVEKVQSKIDGEYYIRKTSTHERNKHEYALLSVLKHPGLPRVYERYEIGQQYVMIEEYIDGLSLQELVDIYGKLGLDKSLDIVLKICDVIHYLHSQKPIVIHRDIKPNNIMLTKLGKIVLIDFGVARRYKEEGTQDTQYVGTLGYAPPEQFGFMQTDHRADIYAIAMTFIYLLTGEHPNRGTTHKKMGQEIPPQLVMILEKASEFDPQNRFESILEFKENLLAVQSSNIIKETKVNVVIKMISKIKLRSIKDKWLQLLKSFFQLFMVILPIAYLLDVNVNNWQDRGVNIINGFLISLSILIIPYIFIYNAGNIDKKWKFFHKRKRVKKIILWVLLLLLVFFLETKISVYHTQEYKDKLLIESK